MPCPYCNSDNVEETNEFDLTNVDKDECRHDFKCTDCGGLFQIIYHPIQTIKVSNT